MKSRGILKLKSQNCSCWCCAPDNNQKRNPWISNARRTNSQTQHKSQTQRKNTKTTINEVRPWCLRPRGKEREFILIWIINYNGCSTSEYQESYFFSWYSKTLEIPLFIQQISDSAQNSPQPDCRSTGRSTDPMYRSTRPVDRSQPRVGYFQSVDWAVDRADSLCMLCTSVDRTGRPNSCYCGRPAGPVDRTPAVAAFNLFCCCCFFRLSSTTSSTIPWRSLSTFSTISSLSNSWEREAALITDEGAEELGRITCEYPNLLRQQEIIWRQKLCINRLKEGDANTSFFHKATACRRAET